MLSDKDILSLLEERRITVTPFELENLQPASIDLTLGSKLRVPVMGSSAVDVLDLARLPVGHTELCGIPDVGYVMQPGAAVLASTVEHVSIDSSVSARVEGKSSLGRVFLAVHITAGFIDPGFAGYITLEIVNLSPWQIVLHRDMPIAQIAFFSMSSPARKPYGTKGHYMDQDSEPVESRYRLTPSATADTLLS